MSYEPQSWCVVFNTAATTFWGRLVPGRFKHVRAYAFVPKANLWLFYDVSFVGTTIKAIPDGVDARAALWEFIGPDGFSDIVAVPRLPMRPRWFPWSNWCTTAIRHLLNMPGRALRPDGFHRECLQNGGTPFEAFHGFVEPNTPDLRSASN